MATGGGIRGDRSASSRAPAQAISRHAFASAVAKHRNNFWNSPRGRAVLAGSAATVFTVTILFIAAFAPGGVVPPEPQRFVAVHITDLPGGFEELTVVIAAATVGTNDFPILVERSSVVLSSLQGPAEGLQVASGYVPQSVFLAGGGQVSLVFSHVEGVRDGQRVAVQVEAPMLRLDGACPLGEYAACSSLLDFDLNESIVQDPSGAVRWEPHVQSIYRHVAAETTEVPTTYDPVSWTDQAAPTQHRERVPEALSNALCAGHGVCGTDRIADDSNEMRTSDAPGCNDASCELEPASGGAPIPDETTASQPTCRDARCGVGPTTPVKETAKTTAPPTATSKSPTSTSTTPTTTTTTTAPPTTATPPPPDHPATEPHSPTPAHGSQDVAYETVTLRWQPATDPDGDPVTYTVFIGTSPSPTTARCGGTTSTSCNVGALTSDTTHYWRVVATSNETDTQGDVWSFRTAAQEVDPCVVSWACPADPYGSI